MTGVELFDLPVILLVELSHGGFVTGVAEVDPASQHTVIPNSAEPPLEIGTNPVCASIRRTRAIHQIVQLDPRGPELMTVLLEFAATA
jgi:hypothetical protein